MLAGDEGGGGIVGVAVIVTLCAVLCAVAPVGGALAARQELQGSADAAALAAADTASGRVPGAPCDAAATVAHAAAGSIESCSIDGTGIATITLGATIFGVAVRATSRAGPPINAPEA
jgi:secretion/DNA translocation related TadE-like protein